MIPAKYFLDESGNIARITRVSLAPVNNGANVNGNSDYYSIGLAYPDNSRNNAVIKDNLDGTYAIGFFEFEEENERTIKMKAVRFIGDTMYYADDTEHIPQDEVICIEPNHISKLIESLTILGNAMELTIASVHNLINAQK